MKWLVSLLLIASCSAPPKPYDDFCMLACYKIYSQDCFQGNVIAVSKKDITCQCYYSPNTLTPFRRETIVLPKPLHPVK